MTDLAPPRFIQAEGLSARPPPPRTRKPLWRALFGDLVSAVLTLGSLVGIALLAPKLLNWAVANGVWSGEGAACRGDAACWAFLREKAPFILFGIYPPDAYWRPITAVLIIVALALWTLPPNHWTRRTLAAWAVGVIGALALMRGGFLGLEDVSTESWGGLPITLLLTVLSLGFGFPLAVALALGRQARMPAVRWLSVGVIEVIRGLPLLSLLFIASILLPIMLPEGMTIDKLLRAQVALTIFAAAYIAEVLRGGLQGVARGQGEAASALGLSWWQSTRLVVLPQAIGKVIPPLTNTVVVIVKNTSLVLIVGLFDLLSAGRAALADPDWPGPYIETYAFVALIYFVICFGISQYAAWLERRPSLGAMR